jgi:carbonic anhydrase/acetyltransferase-like protein (isoleucine patch superfamily)
MKVDPSVYMAPRSIVTGNVTVEKDCGIWYNAVIRGDLEPVTIGERTNIQDNCVVHVATGFPVSIGSGVTIGHAAIIHGCSIGDDSLIGMGAIVMNGATIGKNCLIGAGALVTQGMDVPDGSMAFGSPAKVVRKLSEEQIKSIKDNAEEYVMLARKEKESES